jgi:hypothetical protein
MRSPDPAPEEARMVRRLRTIVLVAIAAAAGALIGRLAAEARARLDAGEDPLGIDFRDIQLRPQELVPGFVAAFRVGEPPWSWLHIPAWLAAFGTNFVISAVGGDLDRLRKMAEERALGAFGIQPEPVESEFDIEIEDEPGPSMSYEPPPAPPAPEPPRAPEAPAPPPPSSSEAPSTVWTAENTGRSSNGGSNGSPSESETRGFTPFRE